MNDRKNASVPTRSNERIAGLDVLRGLAIFGILVVNVEQLFLPLYISESPLGMLPGEWGAVGVWAFTDWLFRTKFLTIFSLLFGAGFALQWSKAKEREERFSGRYLRRIFLLICFGLVHAIFFYTADVLVIYGLTSIGLLILQRLSPKSMLVGGVLLWVVTLGWYAVLSGPEQDVEMERARQFELVDEIEKMRTSREIEVGPLELGPMNLFDFEEEIANDRALEGGATLDGNGKIILEASRYAFPLPQWLSIALLDGGDDFDRSKVEYAVFSEGPFVAQVVARLDFFLLLVVLYTPLYLGWRTLALFLIGAGLVRMGFLEPARASAWRSTIRWGFGLGLPISAIATYCHWRSFSEGSFWSYGGAILQEISALLIALAISAAVFFVAQKGARGAIFEGLSSVGRLALTNYLGQSVVAAFFATSYGLGAFGDWSRWQILLFALVLFGLQMVASRAWMKHFRMGPLEWIWRIGTYFRFFTIRRRKDL